MLPLVAVLPLLANVAKVDIRATGPLTSEAILKNLLSSSYAGGGLAITADHMTVRADATHGSYVIEVSGTSYSAAQIDGYWCANDPMQRNTFKDLVVLNTGLSDVTDVITCVGATNAGCTVSTPCGGGTGGGDVDDDGTPDPAPEPAPTSTGGDDDEGLSVAAIVLIVIGSVLIVGALLYLLWPMISSLWAPKKADASLDANGEAKQSRRSFSEMSGLELPPLLTPA